MRVRIVTPITTPVTGEALQDIVRVARSDDRVDHVQIDSGPASIESEYDEALAAPDTIRKIIEAERDGVDAVVINCMGDPGLYPARQAVGIPVVGPCQVAGHLASSLGHRFSIVTVLDDVVPGFWQRAEVYGFRSHLASVRHVNIPVLELGSDRDRMVTRLVEEAAVAVRTDGADAIVFGCTGMAGVADRVTEGLLRQGIDVPVIDPAPAALKVAEAMVDLHLTQSRRAFPAPIPKPIPGYEDLAPSSRATPGLA